jgi:hypothetical protein
MLRDEDEAKLFSELIFCVQGVGSIKKINDYDVYVKSEHCIESLKDIHKHIKGDGGSYPFVLLTLGEWKFL